MTHTRKLLSVTNLKKYFPVAKTSIFQRQQLYVRANEDISFDIFEGETIGIVGESGCGKSTLGRVVLQLYPQTAGNTMYYGSTLAEMAPRYVKATLNQIDKYRAKYKKAEERYKDFNKKIETVGEENADFYLLQDRNLARGDMEIARNDIVKILGGFFVRDDRNKGRDLLLKLYEQNVSRDKLIRKRQAVQIGIEQLTGKDSTRRVERQMAKRKQEIASLDKEKSAIEETIDVLQTELAQERAKYSEDPEFARNEALRDDGIDLARLRYDELRLLRKNLQVIFQDPYSSLNPRLTIGQIIEEGLVTHKLFKRGSEGMRSYIVEVMEKCGLQEYMLHRYPHQFSGGQRQRIAIARALAVKPQFLVCDEPVSALDVSIQSQIINLLQELKEKDKLTYMFISHDLSVVRYISDRICVMYLGNIVEFADAAGTFNDPRHPYTVALLSSIPTPDQESLEKERILLEGNIPSPIRPPSGCKFHPRCFMATEKCRRVPPELIEVEPGHLVACHYPQRKIDEEGNYLFEMPKMEYRSKRRALDGDISEYP